MLAFVMSWICEEVQIRSELRESRLTLSHKLEYSYINTIINALCIKQNLKQNL
jgi:hypothetical protein